jgi:hypothetical protein
MMPYAIPIQFGDGLVAIQSAAVVNTRPLTKGNCVGYKGIAAKVMVGEEYAKHWRRVAGIAMMDLDEATMTITSQFSKTTIKSLPGKTVQGAILSRNDKTMRVAVEGGDDAVVLKCVNGTWISEDCEPVEVTFDWQRYSRKEVVSESNCICPKELAARLIRVLLRGDEDECGNDDLLERRLAGLEVLQMMEGVGHSALQLAN